MENNDKLKYSIKSKIAISKFKEENIAIKSKFNFTSQKIAVVACLCLVLTSSVVFAKDIEKIITNFFNKNKGITSAIESGYIDELEMNYIDSNNTSTLVILDTENKVENSISVDNTNQLIVPVATNGVSTEEPSPEEIQTIATENTKIKVDNMIMDDFNMSFTFSVKVDDTIDVSKIRRMRFPDMIITDENKNILYCDNKEVFNNYCSENNLDYKFSEFNEHYNNNERSWYVKSKSTKDNTITFIMNLNTIVYPYPKSKKLYINLSQINMTEREIYQNEEYILKGNWNVEVDVDEKFYNRENIVYNVTYCSDDKLTITEACLYNTGMVFEFISQDEPMFNETDSIEIKREKQRQFLKERETNHFVNSEYIENEYGEKFYSVSDGTQTAGTIYETNGKFKHWQTFELTPNNATNQLTVHINLYLHGYERDVIVILEKNN